MTFCASFFSPVLATAATSDFSCSYAELEKRNLCRQLLLDAGADPTIRDSANLCLLINVVTDAEQVRANIPLMTTTHFPDTSAKSSIRTVWNHGLAKIWASFSEYDMFLMASFNVEPAAIAELIRLGADVNARDYQGKTALHNICYMMRPLDREEHNQSADVEAIELLIRASADLDARDCDNHTVADLVYHSLEDSRGRARPNGATSDIFDVSLARCGLDIESFRRKSGKARTAHYSRGYRRRHFEKLWAGYEHLCPYWDDEPWPADLASLDAGSCEELEDGASENSVSSSSSEDGDSSDEEMEVGAAGSDAAQATTVLPGEGLATSRQKARSPGLPSMLADISEAEYSSDSEVEVIREIVPEHFVIEDGAEFSFDFA